VTSDPLRSKTWSPRRTAIASIAVFAVVSLLACGGAIAVFVSHELDMHDEIRAMTEHDYPEWAYSDQTRFGWIVRHPVHQELEAHVQYFRDGWPPFRQGRPSERVNARWLTHETFFRHGPGHAPDPRTGLTYDVDGLSAAYMPLRPPDSTAWIDGVWLESVDPDGTEVYVVHVASKDPGDNLRSDHVARFRRSTNGIWAGEPFASVADE
jgi:hypothetical protein